MEELRCWRPLIIGPRGAVAANHPLAAQAGLLALRAGGNAVDAAVAMALTLVGGRADDVGARRRRLLQCVRRPGRPRRRVQRHRRRRRGRDAGALRRRHPAHRPDVGVGAGHGRRPRHDAPPVRAAAVARAVRRGDQLRARRLRRDAALPALRRREPAPACAPTGAAPRYSCTSGSAPPVGTPIVQPDLARTLEEIAAEGAECFYRGALARRIAAGCAEAGAPVGDADLAECEAERQEPIAIDYRGLDVLEAPPNSTGFVLLQELKIAENFDLKAMGLGSADLVHVMVEAKKLAFADRERWGADPRSIDPPFAELLSAEYAARLGRPHRPAARRADPRDRRRRPATRPTSASSTARATRSPASRASTAPSARGSPPATPASCSTTAWPIGTSTRPPEHPAPRQPRAAHDEPAAGAEGRQAVGGARHARRRQPGADQLPGADRDGRFRPRPAAGGRDAALDLERAGPIRQLPA